MVNRFRDESIEPRGPVEVFTNATAIRFCFSVSSASQRLNSSFSVPPSFQPHYMLHDIHPTEHGPLGDAMASAVRTC